MWQTICYVSTANSSLTDSEMMELFDATKKKNNANNISGILMYSEGNFFQVIQGEEKKIRVLFQNIKKDTRHHTIIKIFDREITRTTFSEYHASFSIVHDKYSQEELEKFLKEEESNDINNFKNISYIANKFIATP